MPASDLMPRKWVMLLFKEMEYNTFTKAVIMMLITKTKLTTKVVEWCLLSKNCTPICNYGSFSGHFQVPMLCILCAENR
jgi:hypothetical protein